jgi:hypothetical protein
MVFRSLASTMLVAAMIPVAPPRTSIPLADVHGLSRRQVRMEAFILPTDQDVRIEAVGEETGKDQALTTMGTASNGKGNEVRPPWIGNAWIIDLHSRRTVWELSAASTTGGRRNTRHFTGTVRLPAGSYAAYVSACPPGSEDSNEGRGIANRVWRFFGADSVGDYKLVVRGHG